MNALAPRKRWMIFTTLLAAGALACSQLPFLGGEGQAAAERAATLEVELERARSTATAAAAGAPADDEEPAFTSVVEEDFTGSTEALALGDGARVEDGALLLGPYEQCANDVGNFDSPVGCLVVCTECGSQLAEYRLRAEFRFEEGLSDREFGVILRFVDENGDRLLDRPDYLLALGFNIYANRWRLYLHEPEEIEPWRELDSGQAGFLSAGRLNQVEVEALENGRAMLVSLNGGRILNLTGDAPDPGERLVEPWADAGAVGFLGLGRGATARFDNFSLEAEGQ